MKSVATSVSKWVSGMNGAGAAYTAGVQAVSVPPVQKAAANQAGYISRVTERAPVWAANVAAVPLGTWQQAAITKGAPRLGSGASAAQAKFTTIMTSLLQFEANAVGQLPPRGPKGSNDQRMLQFSQIMKTYTKPVGA